MSLGEHPHVCLGFPPDDLLDPFADEVNHLADAHEDADGRGNHHEEGEDLLLGGAGYEAVYRVGARLQGALGQAGHVVTIIDVIQDVEEAGIKACLENQTHL